MIRRTILACAGAAALALALLVLLAEPAGADVVTPPGACFGQGSWREAGMLETTRDHEPDDTIVVPRSDTVDWLGRVGDAAPGDETEERAIRGHVTIDLPAGSRALGTWESESKRLADDGARDYDLPSVVSGIKLRLHGQHFEEGALLCSGSVMVEIEGGAGGNPLTYAGAAGLAISGAGLAFAGFGRGP